MADVPHYLTDEAGVQWRVHDVVFAHGCYRRVAFGAGEATGRVFVNAQGVRRSVSFRTISRAQDEESLRRQLQGAGYLPTTRHRPVEDPR